MCMYLPVISCGLIQYKSNLNNFLLLKKKLPVELKAILYHLKMLFSIFLDNRKIFLMKKIINISINHLKIHQTIALPCIALSQTLQNINLQDPRVSLVMVAIILVIKFPSLVKHIHL
jgi:hypothetical protein